MTRRGWIVLFGGSVGARLGDFSLVNRLGTRVELYHHKLGFVKSSAPSSQETDVLVTSQDLNRVFRVNLQQLIEANELHPGDPPVLAGLVWQNQPDPPVPPAEIGETGKDPRGVAQGRCFSEGAKVWVASKGGNRLGEGESEIRSYDFVTGAQRNRIAAPLHPVPFGARGVVVDRHDPNHDEIWVTCFGQQLGPVNPESGDGREVVRIVDRDREAPLSSDDIHIVPLIGGPQPTANRGPFGVTASVGGDKFVACAASQEVWKIGADGNPVLTGGWPVQLHSGNPISVSLDGNGKVWVQFKTEARIVRIDPVTAVVDSFAPLPVVGAPENLGDFSGYWTASGLYPLDTSDGIGPQNNLEKITSDPEMNPFLQIVE